MTDVIITGIGQTPVGEHWDISLRELAFQAIEAALEDSGHIMPQALFVGNMLSQQLSRQAQLGTLLADFAGLNGIEAVTLEAAGASGGAALRAGYLAVASGEVDAALVVGVEKLTDKVGGDVEASLATTHDSDFESIQGLTPTAQAALLMQRYLHEFNPPREAFGGFSVNAHLNAVGNRYAMFRRAIKPEVYAKAGYVSAPLNMFDAAPPADGAAAVVLTRSDLMPANWPHPRVRIAASSAASDTLALHDRHDPLAFSAVRYSVEKALQQAGIDRDHIDLFELYDAYSIFAALSLEAAGFAARGEGWKLAMDSQIGLDGRLPICTFGGLKARGDAGGATGVYQVVEAALQLRGQAGDNQVREAEYALAQCLGGPASTVVTHVLQRLS